MSVFYSYSQSLTYPSILLYPQSISRYINIYNKSNLTLMIKIEINAGYIGYDKKRERVLLSKSKSSITKDDNPIFIKPASIGISISRSDDENIFNKRGDLRKNVSLINKLEPSSNGGIIVPWKIDNIFRDSSLLPIELFEHFDQITLNVDISLSDYDILNCSNDKREIPNPLFFAISRGTYLIYESYAKSSSVCCSNLVSGTNGFIISDNKHNLLSDKLLDSSNHILNCNMSLQYPISLLTRSLVITGEAVHALYDQITCSSPTFSKGKNSGS